MLSISRVMLMIGLVLLVGGAASGGWGIYLQATDTSESGYGVTITHLEENETADPAAEHITYSNLSASEQRVFKETLTAETSPIYQNSTPLEGLTQKVVTYRGEQYETGGGFVSECIPVWPLFIISGGFTVILGGVIVVATYGWRRLR